MDFDQLVDAACARVGATDFGADTWQEGLRVLLAALNTEANLNEIGVAAMTDQIVGHLTNRLKVEEWFARHPEIDDQQIVAPLFGLGLPRTGSTALSFLLAQDQSRRSLRVWEAGDPCPPPEAATEHDDARIATAQAGIDFTNEMFPGFAGMLPTAADGPQECLIPMALDFRSMMFEGMAYVPSYTEWLTSCDMEPAYRYHQRVLKLLQWRCPPDRWWLKSPAHMLSIGALDAVYPDARFVMTHRDIVTVLRSVCALYATLAGVLSDGLDPRAIGAHNTAVWRIGLERLVSFRDAGNASRFVDVGFAALQADPLREIARVYAELGDDLSGEARRRMVAWWEQSASQRASGGRYDTAAFELDEPAIREQYAFYTERFGVPSEGAQH